MYEYSCPLCDPADASELYLAMLIQDWTLFAAYDFMGYVQFFFKRRVDEP